MTSRIYIGWPFSDRGPVVDRVAGKAGRLRMLVQMSYGDHRIRPDLTGAVPDALFELGTPQLEVSMRAALRDAVARYLPGVELDPTADAARITEDDHGRRFVRIQWIDVDTPAAVPDPLTVRIR